MGRRRERNEQSHNSDSLNKENPGVIAASSQPVPPSKKLKTTNAAESENVIAEVEVASLQQEKQQERPKSKKELRAEKKRALRLALDPDYAASLMEAQIEAQKKEDEKEEFRRLLREERQESKIRQQKRLNRERNTPGNTVSVEKKPNSEKKKVAKENAKGKKESSDAVIEEDDVARKVINDIKYGSSDSSGWTTLQFGVKYKDLVVGNGPMVENKSLVTVKYQLTGGKFGTVIDSSKKFNFRLGKGEVIQGWDIGMIGMREGGRRKLVVPPKAGYGSQDIGAGPGALLHFDITILAIRV